MATFRKYWLAGVAIALLATVATGCERALEYLPPLPRVEIPTKQPAKPSIPVQTAKTGEIEAGVRQSINQVREKNGLKPLQNNERLAEIARNYSRQMAEKNFFSHTGADGSTVETRVRAGGISYWVVGENLFKGTNLTQPVKIAVDGWLESPGHRANIMRPYFTETGVGVWRDGNSYYITQLFLRR
ncbi:MAG: CAP domain-containing protein [Chlorogloeopsis fritschii C42_A2020_084]|uniref:CAP domain-containing protein n=1 Tax=Chlorogloeopsis fritschii TaxID=1124 RepID=UPI0019FF9156|nr:CAP domain-containing protein [Chlorogloeopsis fritschii]MBF2008307.1 CAP domain-containing protein [Chlorogloeopsis fritschii C42_A2020_084]